MRRTENAVGKRVRVVFKASVIGNEALPELFIQRADLGFQFLQNPCGKFLIVLPISFYAVENRGLYVGDDKPVNVVKSSFMKLDKSHIDYVLSCMKESSPDIRNIKQYILAALYNAPMTIGNYYQAMYNNDHANGLI